MTDDPEPPLGYAGLAIDRSAARRRDAAFIREAADDDAARFAPFAGDRALLRTDGSGGLDMLFDAGALAALGPHEIAAYLGHVDGAPRFAATIADDAEPADGVAAEDLRALAWSGRLEPDALALGGYAKSMALWHRRHRFCAGCGTATTPNAGGWRRDCTACGTAHFPRVDPVAIMLVTRGDRCLLGRQARFPPGMWSCLAGFVEPGETIEEAARREVAEEAGVAIGTVAYELSQPWPFPSQLMIGVRAEALSDEITPDLDELEDVRWFFRDEVAAMLRREHPDGAFAPPPSAIAHHLLRRFAFG